MRGWRASAAMLMVVAAYVLQPAAGQAPAQVPQDIRASLTQRGHALLIGVSIYDNNAWSPLASVVSDIEDLARGMAPHFSTIETLIDPTTEEIRAKLRGFMTGKWNQPDERLLIYYAGHGFTDYNPNSRVNSGYITGRNTPACRGDNCGNAVARSLPFHEIDALNREARSRQVIMLFDSCFSGSLFLTRSRDSDVKRYSYDRARDALRAPVRYYITAGTANETIPADSPFAQLVLRGLQGEADIYRDGFVTGEALGIYLRRNLPAYARRPLSPQKGTIADARLSVGEFVFLTGLTKIAPGDPGKDAYDLGNTALSNKEYAEALRWYRRAADRGNSAAQNAIGNLYERGLGVPANPETALRWYRMAAEQDYPGAQANIGMLYESGRGVGKDYTEALRWYRKAADQNQPNAQNSMGWLYQNGYGVSQDYAEAMRWYAKAADQGHAMAQSRIGMLYRNGQGVPRDYGEAMRWLQKASNQGLPSAKFNIGLMHEHGIGVAKSRQAAIEWYRMAARQGEVNAQNALRRFGESW